MTDETINKYLEKDAEKYDYDSKLDDEFIESMK